MTEQELEKLKRNITLFLASYFTIINDDPPKKGSTEDAWYYFLEQGISKYFNKQPKLLSDNLFSEVPLYRQNFKNEKMEVGDIIVGEFFNGSSLSNILSSHSVNYDFINAFVNSSSIILLSMAGATSNVPVFSNPIVVPNGACYPHYIHANETVTINVGQNELFRSYSGEVLLVEVIQSNVSNGNYGYAYRITRIK